MMKICQGGGATAYWAHVLMGTLHPEHNYQGCSFGSHRSGWGRWEKTHRAMTSVTKPFAGRVGAGKEIVHVTQREKKITQSHFDNSQAGSYKEGKGELSI